MASLFDKLLKEFWQESQRHRDSSYEEGSRLPDRTWAGWGSLASQLGVQGDSPAFRVRQAVKLALAADKLNLEGEDVHWSALERRLETITTGFLSLSQLPTTEEDLQCQAGPKAMILWDQTQKAGKKGRKVHSYCVVLEGQEEKDGEWFTNAELKRHFPDGYQAMKDEFRQRQSQLQPEGQEGRLRETEGQGGVAAVGRPHAAPGGTTSMPVAEPGLGARRSPQGILGQQQPGQHRHLTDSRLDSRGGQEGGSPGLLAEQRAQEPARSSAQKRAGRASAPPIPGASCVPRREQTSPPQLFSDSGPPASMMLAGILPTTKASPTAAATAGPAHRQRPAQAPASAPAQQAKQAKAPFREQHYVYPQVVTVAQLAAALEPANKSRMQDSSPMLRRTRIAAPTVAVQPVAEAGTAEAAARAEAGTAGPTGDGTGSAERQQAVEAGTTSPKPRQEEVETLTVPGHASLLPEKPCAAALHPPLSPPQQQRHGQPEQLQPAQAAPGVLASPPGSSSSGPQRAVITFHRADAEHASAAARTAGQKRLQDAGYPRRSPQVDFSGVHPLLRRNAEYVYRTTGRLPTGAVFVEPQQQRQSPAQAGLDAVLQLVPKPRGISLGQTSRQSPAVVAAVAAAAAEPRVAAASPSAATLLLQNLLSCPTARRHSAGSVGRAGQASSPQLGGRGSRSPGLMQPPHWQPVLPSEMPPLLRALVSPRQQHQRQPAPQLLPEQGARQASQVMEEVRPLKQAGPAERARARPQHEQHQEPGQQQQQGGSVPSQVGRDLSLAVPPPSLPEGEMLLQQQQQQQQDCAEQHSSHLVQEGGAGGPEKQPVQLQGQAHAAAAVPADSWQFGQPPSSAELQAMKFMRRFPDKAPMPVFPQVVLATAACHTGPGTAVQGQQQPPHQPPQQPLELPAVQLDVPRTSAHNDTTGGEEYYDAHEEPPWGPQPQPQQQPGPWQPLEHDALRTQPDEVQWTAADAAGLGQLQLTQQQQHTPWAPLTQQLGSVVEGHGAPSQQLVVPDTEEQEQSRAAPQAARAPEQPQGVADVKPGGAQPTVKQELVEGPEAQEVVALVGPEDKQLPSLDELLSPEAWATATIRGAKNRDDGVHLAVEWALSGASQHKQALPSSLLLGRPHCMETLIRFYESKATTGGRRKRAEDGDAGGSESNEPDRKRRRKEDSNVS